MGKKVKLETRPKLEDSIKKQEVQQHEGRQGVKIQDFNSKQEREEHARVENHNEGEKQKKRTKKIKHARLILRNLVVDINEKHIRKLLEPFGSIKQISIPKHPDKNCSKGFAFVEMTNRLQCLKAIKKLNGTSYKGRTLVLDQAVAKDKYMAEQLKTKEKRQEKLYNQQKEEEMSNSAKQDIKKQQNEDEDEDEDKDEDKQNPIQNEDDNEQQQEDDDQKREKQEQDHLQQIFIRNIPISTTEQDLYKHFVRHGRIKFVKVCRNKETNLSKGTAFIKFYEKQIAHKLIEYSRSYELFLLKKHRNFLPDPTIKLQIDGAIIKIFPVETRQNIQQKLKERQGQEKSDKKLKQVKKIKKIEDLIAHDTNGKRRLSLALDGCWKAQQNMNKYDYQLFKSHEKEKLEKLKNPNSSVSETRIILKHLDKNITEDQIRTLCFKFLEENDLKKGELSYCKLMLEKDMKKSAGFSFIQFKKAATSSRFIQKMVKKPQILQERPFIVQYAIQDSKKLLKLNKRKQNSQISAESKNIPEKQGNNRFDKNKKVFGNNRNKNFSKGGRQGGDSGPGFKSQKVRKFNKKIQKK